MADWAHNETDRRLEELEKRIREVYGEAAKEIKIKADDYFRKLENRDTQMRNMVNAGEITPEYYTAWRQAQIGRGERVEALYRKLAQRMVEYDKVAIAYVNDDTPGIYSLNYDYMAYTIEQVHGNVDFTLYNEQAVRRLLQDDPDLFPQPSVDIAKDELWNRQKLQSALTSGILQGETLDEIAQRMQEVARMDRTAALRNARTAYTGAQNAGRQAAFERAARMGIKVQKRWMAIKDSRTRDSHGAADGQTVDIDEPFSIGGAAMMFPGDPSGPPKEVYNCRCTMRTVEKPGIEAEPREMRVRDPITGQNEVISEMTYSQWREWKRNQDTKAFDVARKKLQNKGSDRKQYIRYKEIIGNKAGASFEDFQKIKYNDIERWSLLKVDYKRRQDLKKHPEQQLPNAENVVIPAEKFTGYLFNPQSKKGWSKGQVMSSRLGYSLDNYKKLKLEIKAGAAVYPSYKKADNEYGEIYEQKMILYGALNNPTNVVVGWIVDKSNSTRMTSAYVKEVN